KPTRSPHARSYADCCGGQRGPLRVACPIAPTLVRGRRRRPGNVSTAELVAQRLADRGARPTMGGPAPLNQYGPGLTGAKENANPNRPQPVGVTGRIYRSRTGGDFASTGAASARRDQHLAGICANTIAQSNWHRGTAWDRRAVLQRRVRSF